MNDMNDNKLLTQAMSTPKLTTQVVKQKNFLWGFSEELNSLKAKEKKINKNSTFYRELIQGWVE